MVAHSFDVFDDVWVGACFYWALVVSVSANLLKYQANNDNIPDMSSQLAVSPVACLNAPQSGT